jgi:hypothetical protein
VLFSSSSCTSYALYVIGPFYSVVIFIICGHYIRFNVVEVLKLVLEVHIKHKVVDS